MIENHNVIGNPNVSKRIQQFYQAMYMDAIQDMAIHYPDKKSVYMCFS